MPNIIRLGGGGDVIISNPYEQLVNYKMLYDAGNECTDITGGWNIRTGSVTKNATNISIAASAAIRTVNSFTGLGYNGLGGSAKIVNATQTYSRINFQASVDFVSIISGDYDASALKNYKNRGNSKTTGFATNAVSAQIDIRSDYATCEMYSCFLTNGDDYATLCSKAGVTVPSTLASLIADTAKLTTIFGKQDAVFFMVKQCTGDFMASVVADSTALGLLQASAYYTTVQANTHWAKFLAMVA